jgi:hypothetical protein
MMFHDAAAGFFRAPRDGRSFFVRAGSHPAADGPGTHAGFGGRLVQMIRKIRSHA